MRRRQAGMGGMFVAVLLLLAAIAIFAALTVTRSTRQNEQGTQGADRMKRLQSALEAFVAVNGRLPCPADPAKNAANETGDSDPVGAIAACNKPQGVVPWHSLGVKREDALDPWSHRIAYRVYTGAGGSLTQADGASMVQCDTVEPTPAGTTPSGTCLPSQDTTEAQYLAGKGFTVDQFGTAVSGVAYVLVSHGPSGLGAYTTEGSQLAMPASAGELANLGATGGYVAKAQSGADVAAEDAAHFDDTIAYALLADLVRKAGQGARDWPEPVPPPVSNVTLDAATIAAITGSTPSNGSLGVTSLNFGTALVQGYNAGGARTISFNDNGARYDGIGGGTNQLQSSANEYVRITFGQKAGKFALTMVNFGTGTSGGVPFGEQVSLTFYDGAAVVGSTTKVACLAGTGSAAASYSIDAVALFGGQFDRVEIRPVDATNGSNTAFYLSAFTACTAAAATCTTSLAAPTNTCP